MNKLLTRKQAAAYLQVAPRTLSNWKSNGSRYLPCIKVGSSVRYRQQDLDDFVEANVVNPPLINERKAENDSPVV